MVYPDYSYEKFSRPQKVEGLLQVCQISAYNTRGLALTTLDEIWEWSNTRIVLDSPSIEPPHKIEGISKSVKVIAGQIDIFITEDGKIWQGRYSKGISYFNGEVVCIFSKEERAGSKIRLF